jgi:predicted transcriptional regulator
MLKEGIEIETEEELDRRLDELADKVLAKEYEIKFENLNY